MGLRRAWEVVRRLKEGTKEDSHEKEVADVEVVIA